jgi:hypothetical protein
MIDVVEKPGARQYGCTARRSRQKRGDPLRGRIPYFGASKSFDLDSGR